MTSPARVVVELVPEFALVRPKPLRGTPALRNSQSRIRALRHDHERVPREVLEEELRKNRLDRWGEQSEAARICGVQESCLRAWRKNGPLPTLRAVNELRAHRGAAPLDATDKPVALRSVGGAK